MMQDPQVRASDVARFLDRTLHGADIAIKAVRPLHSAEHGGIVFANTFSKEHLKLLNRIRDVMVLAAPEYEGKLEATYIISPNPRLDFARVLDGLFVNRSKPRIANTASIAPSAVIGKGVSIGEFCVIGENVMIGAGTQIADLVKIEAGTIIGRDCRIKSQTVIGEEGFGFEFDDAGTPIRIPHLGRVVIGDDVEIGAANVIARGTLGDTVLRDHVKTDDHVFLAHNVFVDENSVIIAGAEVSGSVRIGRNVWIGPQAAIINKIEIGDGALVGIGAVVTKSVDPNVIVAGNPARVLRKRHV